MLNIISFRISFSCEARMLSPYISLHFPVSGTLTMTALLGVTSIEAIRLSGISVPCPNVLKVQPYSELVKVKCQQLNTSFVWNFSLRVFEQIRIKNVCRRLVSHTEAQNPSRRVALTASRGTPQFWSVSWTMLGDRMRWNWGWETIISAGRHARSDKTNRHVFPHQCRKVRITQLLIS